MKRRRNAAGGKTNKLLMAGGALAGGAASVIAAEKLGLTPVAAGGATAGVALAGSTLAKTPAVKDALYAASMGAGGLVGVQLLGQWYGKHRVQAAKPPATTKRQADGDGSALVTRDELNEALGALADKNADQHKQTCDLMTALHDEIRRVVAETQAPPKNAPRTWLPRRPPPSSGGVSRMPPTFPPRDAVVEEHFEDEYMRNAYGLDEDDEMRNARRSRQQRKPPVRVSRPARRPVPSRTVTLDVDSSGFDDSNDGGDYSDAADDSTGDSQGPSDEQIAEEQRTSNSTM